MKKLSTSIFMLKPCVKIKGDIMDRYEKVKNLEGLQRLQNSLQKLLEENSEKLKLVSVSETPYLICTNITENEVYHIYYFADLDRVETKINEFLPNTIDLQGRLECSFDFVSIEKTRAYLNNLITEIIRTNDVKSWLDVNILLERKLDETHKINHKK